MLNVYLLRHGETRWNADGNRYCGRSDIPLTEKGVAQAESVHGQLKGIVFDEVYSSPLQRALHTAQIAGGKKNVITDDRLIEIDFGKWEGKTKEEFIREDPATWNSWMNDPAKSKAGGTGENAEEVVNRVDEFYRFVLQKHHAGNILVVGHNGINRLYLCEKLGMPLKNYRKFFLDNAAITLFTLDENGSLTLQCLNARM